MLMEKKENPAEEGPHPNGFDFWQDHSERFLMMAFNREGEGMVENPDGYGKKTGDCGDTIEFFLTIDGHRIKAAAYRISGCLYTYACAGTVGVLAEGRSVDEAWEISPQNVIDYLETLPADHTHCAELAVGAFYLALSDYQKKQGCREKDATPQTPK